MALNLIRRSSVYLNLTLLVATPPPKAECTQSDSHDEHHPSNNSEYYR